MKTDKKNSCNSSLSNILLETRGGGGGGGGHFHLPRLPLADAASPVFKHQIHTNSPFWT